MQYVYNLLAVILIGLAIGSVLGQHTSSTRIASIIAIVLGALAFFFSPSWMPLAAGAAVFLLGQGLHRDPKRVGA